MKRRAEVSYLFLTSNEEDIRRQIEALLPSNYEIVEVREVGPREKAFVIEGEDNAGWTLHDYVIPRLFSGMFFAKEVST